MSSIIAASSRNAVGLVDGELVNGVEREELQACHAVEVVWLHEAVHKADATAIAGVAVAIRGADHPVALASGAHKSVIDGPGVDADAEQLRLGCDGSAQPHQDVPVELEDVPVQAVGGPDRFIGEPVHDLHIVYVLPAPGHRPMDRPLAGSKNCR
jgi:hypothetical protein